MLHCETSCCDMSCCETAMLNCETSHRDKLQADLVRATLHHEMARLQGGLCRRGIATGDVML